MTTYAMEAESPFNENEVTDLAAELLGVSNDRELDQFLGALLRCAAAARGALGSPVLHPLGTLVKRAVRRVLPGIGQALSGLLDPAAAGHTRQLAARASQLLGVELEGLSGEDQEFAAAKQLVRLAGTAATEAALNTSAGNPGDAARQALVQAAQAYAPGLLRSSPSHHQSHREHSHSHDQSHHDCGCGGTCGGCAGGAGGKSGSGSRTPGRSGSWVRRGNEIILEGL
jgi:hypothetical protein